MRNRITGFVVVSILILSMLCGCGSGANKTASVADEKSGAVTTTAETMSADAAVNTESTVAGNGQASITNYASAEPDSVTNTILDQRKVIRSANITVEVDNFDVAYGEINSAILGIGFIQETNINTDRVYVDKVQKLVKNGTIVIRVDRDKFDKVLNGLKEIGAVLNWSIKGDDVTEKYYDTESRLKLLRLEEERVLEYLKKLDNPDKIVTYENRLTEIRHEIESLTGTLRKITDLVDLSTITITMNEKYPGSDKPVLEKTYWDRLGEKFTQSMKSVIDFCGDFVIFIISAVPVLILLGLFAWLIIVIYRKIWHMVRGNKTTVHSQGSNDTNKKE